MERLDIARRGPSNRFLRFRTLARNAWGGSIVRDYRISSITGRCAATGREFAEGEEFYSVLFDRPEGFVRQDFSLEAWAGPPADAWCYWKSRVPRKEEPKRVWVDNDALLSFFLRLEDEKDETRQAFRFVLALILMRKRILKYEETQTTEDGEVWRMTLATDKTTHEVLNPGLDEERIEAVTAELNAILHSDVREQYASAPVGEDAAGEASDSAADESADA